ncbi:unnamed protein product, partial [Nesidiocoris tenuis]
AVECERVVAPPQWHRRPSLAKGQEVPFMADSTSSHETKPFSCSSMKHFTYTSRSTLSNKVARMNFLKQMWTLAKYSMFSCRQMVPEIVRSHRLQKQALPT